MFLPPEIAVWASICLALDLLASFIKRTLRK